MRPLTLRQEAFCQEYLKDYNATQAAIRAGFKGKANVYASALLSKPNVQERLTQLLGKLPGGMANTFKARVLSKRKLDQIVELDFAHVLKNRKPPKCLAPFMCSPIEPEACVYFLVKGDAVVYVGKSTRLIRRLRTHVSDQQKAFDSVFYIPVSKDILDEAEEAFIAHFRPKLNRKGVTFCPVQLTGRHREILVKSSFQTDISSTHINDEQRATTEGGEK